MAEANLNDIAYSLDTLHRLAAGNFERNVGSIIMHGATVVDIVAFGISKDPAAVDVPLNVIPEAPEAVPISEEFIQDFLADEIGGFEEEKEEGVLEEAKDDFDFGPEIEEFVGIEQGELAALNLQELLAGREAPFPEVDPLFVEDEPVERPAVRQRRIPGVESVLVPFPNVTDGVEWNYANISSAKQFSHGFSRRRFFYAQLPRMFSSFLKNIHKYDKYQLAATLVPKRPNAEYGNAVALNFGTTDASGVIRQVPHNAAVWPFDIHDPLNTQVQRPAGAQIVTGSIEQFDQHNFVDFLRKMINSLEDAIPASSDSGSNEFDETDLHLVNVFLYKIRRSFFQAGGAERYDVSGETSNTASISNKSVYTPKVNGQNTCFWDCIIFALYRRYYGSVLIPDTWYTPFLRKLLWSAGEEKKSSSICVRRFIIRYGPEFRKMYFDHVDEEVNDGYIELSDFAKVLEAFDFKDGPVVLNTDGEVLLGDLDGVENRRFEKGHFTALLLDSHLHLILSYTGSLVVKKCRRCDMRFTRSDNLLKHLDRKSCMTCVCKKVGEHFDSEAEWREHIRMRASICPEYRLIQSVSVASTSKSDKEKAKQRFVNDKRMNYYQKKRAAQNEFEKDNAPMRTHQECIYFDLESVVPMNEAGVAVNDQEVQQPYAAGWIRRQDALCGGDVSIEYGPNCIELFVKYLDKLYVEIVKSEKELWFSRAATQVEIDPLAKKIQGFENYTHRVKRSWDTFFEKSRSDGCIYCNDPLDEMHGYIVDTEKRYEFTNCALKNYAEHTAMKNIETNFNSNAPRIPIWAHNGGKYDWVFLHRYLIEAGKLDDVETIRSNSKYYQLTYKKVFEFKDSLSFIMGSLDKLGKDFGVETLKGLFPYRLLNSMTRIDMVLEGEEKIREMIPHEFFQVPEILPGPMHLTVKRAMSEEEYVEFFSERDWCYSIHRETVKYLKDDVMCLFGVVEKFRQGWKEMPHSPELFKYCTIGQMCHTYFLDYYLESKMYPCLDACEDGYIRKALYGGRTEVFERIAPEEGKIHYVDVNSLYPYVMESRDLPSGDPTWHFRKDDPTLYEFTNSTLPVRTKVHDEHHFDEMKKQMNEGKAYDLYGFMTVDFECNPLLLYPVLPEKRSLDGGKTEKNMFTNMSKTKQVYYTEELKRAILKGGRITKIWSYSEWQRGRVYGELIHVLKKQKLLGEGKDVNGVPIEGVPRNPSLRAAAKTAQNSLFGKTIQFVDSHVELVHTRERLFRVINDAFSKVSITPVFRSNVSDVVEVTRKHVIPKIQRRSCAAIGTAILAEARLVLYDYFDKVVEVGGKILYCDTDSIVFSGSNPLGEECMDDSAYGKMKVEIDPDTIKPGGFVGMSPKCYAFDLKNGDPYVRFKGVVMGNNLNTSDRDAMSELVDEMECEEMVRELALPIRDDESFSQGASFDQMKKLILGQIDVLIMKQMQFRKTTERTVSACNVVKMIRTMFDKRMIGDGGATFPWNEWNMRLDQIVEDKDKDSLMMYFGVATAEELQVIFRKFRDNAFFTSLYNSCFKN